jgi:hypothetical protein
MKDYIIYYNKLNIDNKNKVVTVDEDCPFLTHVSENKFGAIRLAETFVRKGLWKTWFSPQIAEVEGYDFKFKK